MIFVVLLVKVNLLKFAFHTIEPLKKVIPSEMLSKKGMTYKGISDVIGVHFITNCGCVAKVHVLIQGGGLSGIRSKQ